MQQRDEKHGRDGRVPAVGTNPVRKQLPRAPQMAVVLAPRTPGQRSWACALRNTPPPMFAGAVFSAPSTRRRESRIHSVLPEARGAPLSASRPAPEGSPRPRLHTTTTPAHQPPRCRPRPGPGCLGLPSFLTALSTVFRLSPSTGLPCQGAGGAVGMPCPCVDPGAGSR